MSTSADEIMIPSTPNLRLATLRRYLHILALLQNRNDQTNWNGSTLADILTLEESTVFGPSNGRDISDTSVRGIIDTYLRDELGIDIGKSSGSRKMNLNRNLDNALLEKVISVYSTFVVKDTSRDVILKRVIEKQPVTCLWNMATVYFASIQGRMITFDYTDNNGRKSTPTVAPYYLVIRTSNLYLCGRKKGHDSTNIYIFNRITNLKESDTSFDRSTIPGVGSLFKDSLSAFIGTRTNVINVEITYSAKCSERIYEIISILDPAVETISGSPNAHEYKARFTIADDIFLCKQLFMYGSEVEIVKPLSLRTKMKEMLKESLKLYEE